MTARSASRAPKPPPGLPSGWQHVVDRAAGLLVLAAAGKPDREFRLLAFDFFSGFYNGLRATGFAHHADRALDALADSVDRQRVVLAAATGGRPGRA